MLQRMLQDEIRSRGLSVRRASRQIGVSHTTVFRALEGKQLDLPTIELICKWLGVNTNEVLRLPASQSPTTSDKLAVLISRNPRLLAAMDRLVEMYENKELEAVIVADVLAYISYRVTTKL
jgi:transcriptional regulator with XRE-family HTH domain